MKVFVRLLLPIVAVAWLVGIATLSMSSNVDPVSTRYIGNTRSHVFHRQHCKYLPDMENRSYFDSRKQAIDAGYRPCRKCRP